MKVWIQSSVCKKPFISGNWEGKLQICNSGHTKDTEKNFQKVSRLAPCDGIIKKILFDNQLIDDNDICMMIFWIEE